MNVCAIDLVVVILNAVVIGNCTLLYRNHGQ